MTSPGAVTGAMRTYALYVLRRLGQFVLVVFIGINIAFFVTHLTPIDPVEQAIAAITRIRPVRARRRSR